MRNSSASIFLATSKSNVSGWQHHWLNGVYQALLDQIMKTPPTSSDLSIFNPVLLASLGLSLDPSSKQDTRSALLARGLPRMDQFPASRAARWPHGRLVSMPDGWTQLSRLNPRITEGHGGSYQEKYKNREIIREKELFWSIIRKGRK